MLPVAQQPVNGELVTGASTAGASVGWFASLAVPASVLSGPVVLDPPQPTAMASRNWMLRRMMLESIRNDPDYNNGDYTTQPRSMKIASVFFGIATSGGTLNTYGTSATNISFYGAVVNSASSGATPAGHIKINGTTVGT